MRLGTFYCSGTLLIGDPCYTEDGRMRVDVREGVWEAYIQRYKRMVARMYCTHSQSVFATRMIDYKRRDALDLGHVGVDSGQVAILDLHNRLRKMPRYPMYWSGKLTRLIDTSEREHELYERICSATLGKKQAGRYKYGFFSSSGYGDGSYPTVAIREKGHVVRVSVYFIEEAFNDWKL